MVTENMRVNDISSMSNDMVVKKMPMYQDFFMVNSLRLEFIVCGYLQVNDSVTRFI